MSDWEETYETEPQYEEKYEDISPRGIEAIQGTQDTSSDLAKDSEPTKQSDTQSPPGDSNTNVGTLPNGQSAEINGQPQELAKYNHLQGQNELGYQGTCGLVSCEDVINQYGQNVNENDIVSHADINNLCLNEGVDVSKLGGTTPEDQVQILNDYGIPAHVETGKTMDDLASYIEQDRGAILEVNAGELWNDANYLGDGGANHAVAATGVARDPGSGDILGFYINDSGTNQAGQFVDAETMANAWEETGGTLVVVDKKRTT